jgi:RND family efflux transporter MFP subunit
MNAPDVSRLRIRRSDEWREPRRRGPMVAVIAVLLVLAGAALAWWKVAASVRPLEITVATVLPPDVGGGGGSVLTASGYIVARRKAGVGPKVAGLLEWLGPEEGDKVREGEVIGRLQNRDVVANLEVSRSSLEEARANLVEAQANLAQYRKEFDRARALLAEGVISGADYDVAESRLAAQEARVRSQRAAVTTAEAVVRSSAVAVEDTSIRAPFTGTVLTKDAEEGETVAPAAAGRPSSRGSIVTMADLATLEAEVDVNESYIARLRQGQPARIVADSFPDRVYRGEIRQVIPTADRQKATVQVKVGIMEPGDLLRPDMGAKVTFLESAEAAAAPAHPLPRVTVRAIATGADGIRRVFVVEGETVRTVRVEVAGEADGMAEIRSGLAGGESVVTDPPAGLAEGRKVRART